MTNSTLSDRLQQLQHRHRRLLERPNETMELGNGIYNRWRYPVVTAEHVPLTWRYDLNIATNPFLMERLGVNATFNAGALYFEDQFCLMVRIEGADRKSFFGLARSSTGVDGFEFTSHPIRMPETEKPDTNIYDIRLTEHEDGYIYGLFCTERPDKTQPQDTSAADAQCGIARTRNLVDWERLPDLATATPQQQRNVVLHPEFVDGKYGLYTRPQDGFIEVGTGGGIGWALCDSMERATVGSQTIVDEKAYHTIKELKNGQGPPPIKTSAGWLHLAHGVRGTAAGLRYVLYLLVTRLDRPWEVLYRPGGYLIAPHNEERVGDVSNVTFCNGWIEKEGQIYIYYASSDTRTHVATTDVERLIDYAKQTPQDGARSATSVAARFDLIDSNIRNGFNA